MNKENGEIIDTKQLKSEIRKRNSRRKRKRKVKEEGKRRGRRHDLMSTQWGSDASNQGFPTHLFT